MRPIKLVYLNNFSIEKEAHENCTHKTFNRLKSDYSTLIPERDVKYLKKFYIKFDFD